MSRLVQSRTGDAPAIDLFALRSWVVTWICRHKRSSSQFGWEGISCLSRWCVSWGCCLGGGCVWEGRMLLGILVGVAMFREKGRNWWLIGSCGTKLLDVMTLPSGNFRLIRSSLFLALLWHAHVLKQYEGIRKSISWHVTCEFVHAWQTQNDVLSGNTVNSHLYLVQLRTSRRVAQD
jgi:hypothetical protein